RSELIHGSPECEQFRLLTADGKEIQTLELGHDDHTACKTKEVLTATMSMPELTDMEGKLLNYIYCEYGVVCRASNKEIAEALNVSKVTVKRTVGSLRRKGLLKCSKMYGISKPFEKRMTPMLRAEVKARQARNATTMRTITVLDPDNPHHEM